MNPTVEMRIMGITPIERKAYRQLRKFLDRDNANLAMVGFVLFDRAEVFAAGATFKANFLQISLENLTAQMEKSTLSDVENIPNNKETK